ncbi:post-transcriptional regulator [Alicyclobacillus macrosporangiidus]|uniref:post-transcriptional regulator n=1 Tax=Alicyclobacillus macrosporangiidus TaxID=392015 RepID=UPI0026EAA779|nr:post-transcriptional regulator [Alicyclobacillus macrosporangiidus]
MESAAEREVRWQDYEPELMELCRVKAEEFHLLGYEEVTPADVWACVMQMTRGRGALHDVVAAILGLNVGRFMTYLTMNAYQGKLGTDVFDASKQG